MASHAVGHVASYVRAGKVSEAGSQLSGGYHSERGNEGDMIDVEGETKDERLSLRLAHWFRGRSLDPEFSTEHHAKLIVEFGCSAWDDDVLVAKRFREDVHSK